MENSHPLPGEPHISRRSLPSNHTSSVTSPINNPTAAPCLNQQSRRLQLRNAGFRGPVLPARRISPIFGSSQHAPEAFSRPTNSENSPISPDKQKLYGEDLPPSPVNILQEIHNSKRRRPVLPRAGVEEIFQDDTVTESIEGSGHSWFNETRNGNSSIGLNMTPIDTRKLREVSLNGKTPPPPSSPLVKQVKSRNQNHPTPRSTSSEAAKYIEHLEIQLDAVNARLDSVTSPSTNKARSAKLRALMAESRSLRQEVSDWEHHFAERVREESGQRLDVEIGLKTRLLTLEDGLESKDARIRELECELESIQSRVKEAEELEAVNLNLERRIDVLTNLLVQSPTKLELSSATSSPRKANPHQRTPRPRSMLPRVPFSPGGVRLPLSTVSESPFWHSRSFGSTSSISGSPERADATAMHEEEAVSPGSNRESRQFSSIDLDSGASTLFRSVSFSSRPTSIQSASSLGTASWGLPLPQDPGSQAQSINRQRRMRRFPSGSCSLKPLILPTAATIPSLPASAPIYPSSPTLSRNITDISLDPTTAFLSRYDFSSPTSTPKQPIRRNSASWAQEQALRSLEGKDSLPEHAYSPSSSPPKQRVPLNNSPMEAQRPRRARPRSLEEELEHANILAKDSFEDGLIPVELDRSAELDTIPIGLSLLQSHTPSHNDTLTQRHTSVISDTTPRPGPRPVPTEFSSPKTFPSSGLAVRNMFGMFSRLVNLMGRTKQEPYTLAQRLLCNAWILGSARLSGMGWWLIGLVFGSCCGKGKRAADGGIGDGPPKNHFDWHHYSARASRRRTAEHYLRDDCADYELLPEKRPQPRNGQYPSTTRYPRPRAEPHVIPCAKCIEPSSRRTLRLWWQFSLAIVLALGVAIKHGPGALLVDETCLPSPPPIRRSSPRTLSHQPLKQDAGNLEASDDLTSQGAEGNGGRGSNRHFTFVEPLGPGDFESA